MKRELQLRSGTLVLECNAATPLVGKRIFNFDFLQFFGKIGDLESGDQIDKFERIAFTMAMQAEKPLKEAMDATEDEFIIWLSQFDFDEMTNTILKAAVELWSGNQNATSKAKNPSAPQ